MYSTRGFRRAIITVVFCFAVQQVSFCFSMKAWANPRGGQVVAGQAAIQQQGSNLTVTQGTNRAVINWQGFSIGSGESTRFIQPSSSSAALNRVTGFGPSRLDGSLTANGQIYLINPNGVVIGPSGRIETGGFFASTLNVPDASFMAGGDLNFFGDSLAGIKNLGTIKAASGDIILAARTVENAGTLQAPNGVVGLAAGNEVLYRPGAAERLFVKSGLAAPEMTDGVANTGLIEAARAELRAAGGNIYALAVNNGGAIHATGVSLEDGRVLLTSAGGAISAGGTITAKKANGDGGEIRIKAEGEGPGSVTVSGNLTAAGIASGATGGDITITGKDLTLTETARLNASGDAGGGLVRIGGDYRGGSPDIHNASATTVQDGAEIAADALTGGNGGRVIVWSDEKTDFRGRLSARGGYLFGDGGFAEVSGKSLRFQGRADLAAPKGAMGTLLLDPEFIYISDSYGSDTGDGTTDWWRPSSISTTLNASVARYILEASNSLYFTSGTISWNNASELVLRGLSGGVFVYKEPGGNSPVISGVNGGLELQGRRALFESDTTIAAKYMRVYPYFDTYGFYFDGRVTLTDYLQIIGRAGGSLGAATPFSMTHANNTIPRVIFGDGSGTELERRAMYGDTTIVNGNGAMSLETAVTGGFDLIKTSHFDGNLTVLSKGDLTLSNYLVFDPAGTGEVCILATEGKFINNGTPLSLFRGAGVPNLVSQLPYVGRMLVLSNDPRNDTLGASNWWWNPTAYGDPAMNSARVYAKNFTSLATLQTAVSAAPLDAGNWFAYRLTPLVTLTPAGGSKEYGAEPGAALWNSSGVIPGDTLSGNPAFSSPVTYQSNAGTYNVTLTGLGTVTGPSGYTFQIDNSTPGTYTVTKKTLNITAQDVTRLYGESNPAVFPATYAGLTDWDKDLSGAPNPGVLNGVTLYASTAIGGANNVTQQSNTGNYSITWSGNWGGVTSTNYTVGVIWPATLRINPAPLTATVDNKIRRIGDPNPAFTLSYTGLKAWDDPNNPSVLTDNGMTTTATVNSSSGNYPIVSAGGWARNYDVTYVNGTLTIKQPYQLVITANDMSKIYGNSNPAFTYSYVGFEDGDTAAKVSNVLASTPAGDRSPVGTYAINPSGGTFPPYYTALYVPGRLTITPRMLNIYANNTSTEYGTPASFTYTTDILSGDSLSSAPTLSTTGRNVGTYAITVSGGAAGNYTIVGHDGTLTITPVPLAVRANDLQMLSDQSYPAFTASATGLKYNDTVGVLRGLNLVLDPAGPTADTAGTSIQSILQSGTLTAANYFPITFSPGTLRIVPASTNLTINTVSTTTVNVVSSSTGGNTYWSQPFGVPATASDAMQYVARNVTLAMGLHVTDFNAWLADPSNRALIVPALFEFLKAPLKEGSVLYNQREIIKNALQDLIREMEVKIAQDAVARYQAWKAENAKKHTRMEGLFGNVDVPTEDFVNSATNAYIGGALSVGALGAFAVAFGVGGSMSLALPASIAPFATSLAGTVASSALGASGIAAGAVLAIAGTVVRAIQVTEYQKVEDKYNNLVNNARNFDIDTLLNGDATSQQQLFGLMMTIATTSYGPDPSSSRFK